MNQEISERSYERGRSALARGNYRQAAAMFGRAERGGIDVSARLRANPVAGDDRKKITSASSTADQEREKILSALREARLADSGKPLPVTPSSLEIPPPQKKEIADSRKPLTEADVEDIVDRKKGGSGSGGGYSGKAVVSVKWNPETGALDIAYSDGSTDPIQFEECHTT